MSNAITKPRADRDPYSPGGRLHWIRQSRRRNRPLTKKEQIAWLTIELDKMVEGGDLIKTSEGYTTPEEFGWLIEDRLSGERPL